MNLSKGGRILLVLAAGALLTLVAMILATQPIRAAGPWYVAPGGDDGNGCLSPATPCASINGAIGKASSGDTIYVAIGTYTGTGDEVVLVDRDATLSGGWDASFTVQSGNSTIDGENSRRGMTVNSGVTATVDRFAIQNGYTGGHGGGVYNGGILTLTSSTISDNTATLNGGGIQGTGGSSTVIMDSQIYGNTAQWDQGGGISADGGDVHLVNSWIVGNAAENNEGGGVSVGGGGSFYGENCIIAGNYAGTSAGGLWLYMDGPFHLVNCDVVGNDTANEGGALATAFSSQIEITNTLIITNGGNTGIADRDGSGSVFLLNYCDTYGNSPDGTAGVTINRTNCLGTPPGDGLDPLMAGGALPAGVGPAFADEWMSYSYRLQAGSPAIDVGTPGGAPPTDIEGNPRDALPDMGAYELVSGVRISPPAQTNNGARGEVVAHEAMVINGTGATDTFDLVLGSHVWDTSLSADSLGPIETGASAPFTVFVTVPLGVDWYSIDTVSVTATSVTSPTVYSDTASFTTEAYAPPQVSVTPDVLTSTQNVGEVAIETLTIDNGNGVPLEFEVVPQGGLPVQEGLVSWWPGEGDAADIADGNDGTLQGGTGFAAGKVGQAFSFDGIDDRVNVGSAANLHVSADEFTIVAWVKFASDDPWPTGDDMSIADKMSDLGVNGDGWRLFRQRDFGNLLFCLGGGGDNGCDHWAPTPPTTVMATTIAQKNVWYHVAGVLSSSEISIYVNGVLEDSKPRPAFTDSNSTDLLIGANAPEGAYLDGFVDEVALFNRALTEAEIQTMFNWQGGIDAPWLSTDPTAGTVTANSSVPVEVTFDANGLQPDTYTADLIVQSNDPVTPSVSIPVTMTVLPTANMGWVEGAVTDALTGDPLEASVVALGQPYTITTDPDTGSYTFWLNEGSFTLQASSERYVTQTVEVEIAAQQGTTQDFALVPAPDHPIRQVFLPLCFRSYCPDFFDDFSNPASGWDVVDDSYVRTEYLNGEYRVLTKQSGYFYLFKAPACDRQNYTVEVDARWAGTPGSSYGLIFGVTGGYGQYYLFDMNTDYKQFRLLRREPSGFTTVVPITGAPAINGGTASNHLKVTRNGAAITLEVNGTVLGTWYDGTIGGSTGAGLVTNPYDGIPTSDARFDNFSMVTLPGDGAPVPDSDSVTPDGIEFVAPNARRDSMPLDMGW